MTITRVSGNAPTFMLLSTDIVDNTFNGALSFLGAKVLATDTGKEYRIKSDGTLAEWTTPVSLGSSVDIGDVTLLPGTAHVGKIEIDTPLPAGTNIIGTVVGLSTTVTQTIAINTAVATAGFDMSNYIGGMVITPTVWTAANIGFYVCDTLAGTYVIAKDKTGVPIQISTVATGAAGAYAIPTEIFTAKFVKLWSKNTTAATETDINQAAERVLKVMLK